MTTVAGLVQGDRVAIAADSCNNVYDRPIIGGATKVRVKQTRDGKDEFLLAVTGEGALMVVIRDDLAVEEAPKPDDDPQPWADAVACALTEAALERHLRNDDGRMDGTVLLGWNRRLWSLTHMQAIPHPDGMAVLGSGSDYALGALTVLAATEVSAEECVRQSVAIACAYDKHSATPIDCHVLVGRGTAP